MCNIFRTSVRSLLFLLAKSRDGSPTSRRIERFNRTYRNEVLDAYLFKSIEQVQHITEEWLLDYNERRPRDALGDVPPRQFLPRITTAADSCSGMST